MLFHTGWGRLWYDEPDRVLGRANPGPGIDLAGWLVDQRVAADRLRHVELRPGAGGGSRRSRSSCRRRSTPATASSWSRTSSSSDLARDGVHEFLLVIAHSKLRGATGSWVAPLAIV